ncbi:MAG: outer membrane lipoprotein-sorting protein [Deltaproteobacteria bacterium]|nr:outer membrane lipoprotein-sorting protein [Deltaproteobacteria bacterium]
MSLRLCSILLSCLLAASASAAKPKAKSASTKTVAPEPAPAVAPAPAEPKPVAAPEPSAAEVLQKVDAILSPAEFEARLAFVTHKPKGDTRFSMSFLKKGSRFRSKFLSPPDDAGAEVLRIGDDFWNYLPNLKRALKISAKQEFHGGDFANSDVLQLELTRDYLPALAAEAPQDHWLLDLKAKNDEVTYARIKVAVRKKDSQPVWMEYFSGSGKLVRRMELSELRTYGTLVRPTRYVMRNMLETKRYSELVYEAFSLKANLDEALFDQAALGR